MAEIRRANAGDAQALASLGAQTFVETFGHLYRREDLDSFLAKNHDAAVYAHLLRDQNYAIWMIEDEAAGPAGYCVAGPCSLPVPGAPPRSGELSRLYLLSQFKGRGIGARALDVALAWLTARYDRIFLSVYYENFPAQRLYASRGFVKICDYFYMVGTHADPEWIMELTAPRAPPTAASSAPQQGAD